MPSQPYSPRITRSRLASSIRPTMSRTVTIEQGASDKNRLVPSSIQAIRTPAVAKSKTRTPLISLNTSIPSSPSSSVSTPSSPSSSSSWSPSPSQCSKRTPPLPPLPDRCPMPQCQKPTKNVVQHLESHYPLPEHIISDLHLQFCDGCLKHLRQINKHRCTKTPRRNTRPTTARKTRKGMATTAHPKPLPPLLPRVRQSEAFAATGLHIQPHPPSVALTLTLSESPTTVPSPCSPCIIHPHPISPLSSCPSIGNVLEAPTPTQAHFTSTLHECPSVGDVCEFYHHEVNLWVKVDVLQADNNSGNVLIQTCEGQLLPQETSLLYEWIHYLSEYVRPIPPTPEDVERQKLDDEFRQAILNEGFSIENCNKDGNCMFRAFASHIFGSQERHDEVRKICYDYMEEHLEDFQPFLTIDIATYITDQRQLGKWGDECEISALRQALNVNVIIYRKGSEPASITQTPHITDPTFQTIRLSYHGGTHYNLLRHYELSSPSTPAPPPAATPALTMLMDQHQRSQPSISVPSTLPPSYKYMPHLWRTLPESAKPSWNASAYLVLQQAVKAHRANQPLKRDAAFVKFIHLPRTALNKINKDRFKSRKLRKQLNLHQKQFRQSIHEQQISSEAAEAQPTEQYEEDLYKAFQPSPFDDPSEDTHTRIIRKASRQVREGYISKAINTLKSDKVATIDDETIEILKSLHPASTGSLPKVLSPDCIKVSISGDDLKSLPDTFFDNGSAPGPSGWTGALIVPLFRYTQTANALALLFTLIINGEISDGPLRDCLLAARLIPMVKPNTINGIRPLAVGEIITRISANLVLRNSHCHVLFPSIQLGMKVSGGPERAIHTIQSLLENQHANADNDNTVILISTDIKNAYNTCSRNRIFNSLQQTPAAAPLIPLFQWSHRSNTPLLIYDHHIQTGTTLSCVIQSQEGVRQGDPLAGIAYDICVQEDYEWVQSQVPTVKLIAIHDDLNIVGPQKDAFKAYDLFQRRLIERGDLKLQPTKCRALIPVLQNEKTYHHCEIEQYAEDRHIQVIYGSMPILGGCVGIDDQLKSDFIKANIVSHQSLFHSIENKFMPSQISYLILKMCINTKVNYLTRITRPDLGVDHFRHFDKSVIKTIQHKMELPHNDNDNEIDTSLSEFTIELIRLPTSLGGYGIPSALETSPVAYFSSVVACLPYLLPLPSDGLTLMTLKRCHTSLLTTNTGIVPSDRIPTDFVTMLSTYSSIDSASKSRQIQHYITEQVNKFAYTNILNRSTPIQRAMLGSASAPSAGLAFTVLPTCYEYSFTSPYFNQITRLRLGLPYYDYHETPEEEEKAEAAEVAVNDRDHQGEIHRHNLIAHSIIRIAQDAGYETSREVNLLDDNGIGHRVDAVLYSQYASRPSIMVDVSVADPRALSHIRAASLKSLASASLREKEKEKEYSKVVKENHGIFYPLIIETYGGFGNKLTKFLKMVQTDAIDHHQLSERESQAWLHKAKCSVATALQLGNGRMFNRLMRRAFTKRRRGPKEMEELLSQNVHSNLFSDLVEQCRETTAEMDGA